MKIDLVDLKAQYHRIKSEIDAAISLVVNETSFIGGAHLKSFEKSYADYCGTQYAVGVSNGTDALRLALLACGVQPGDEVVTVPNTFIATAEAISMVGANVRFVDVDPETMNMNPSLLKSVLTEKTRAILPVHLYGHPADMDPILDFAREHGLRVIGDAAQAHGSLYKGRKIGILGDAVCFSFYPGKNLGAYGDAGAVVTNDPAIADRVSKLRDHGRSKKYEHGIIGFNCRMDALQSAILSVKLRHLEKWTNERRRATQLYNRCLSGCKEITLPTETTDVKAVYHLYVVKTAKRESLMASLKEKGIFTGIHYPIPLHRQPAYAHLHLGVGSFPVAEKSSDEILSLPMYPELTEEQVCFISEAVLESLR